MKIFGKNNNFDNQPIGDKKPRKTDVNYEEKDIANSPNPAEYLGRSQVVFRGKSGGKLGGKSNQNNNQANLEPIKLVETPLLSKEKALECLREYHFNEEDIKTLDLDDVEILAQISNFSALTESGTVKKDELEKFKKDMDGYSAEEKQEMLKFFSDPAKYANKENFEQLRDYIEIKDSTDFSEVFDFMRKAEDSEGFFEKLPLITSVQGKLGIKDLRNFRYFYSDNYEQITPERTAIINQINRYLPEDAKLHVVACQDLAKQEKELTPEVIDKHCKLIEELSKLDMMERSSLKYSYAGDTILDHTGKMEKVTQMLKEYPLDLKATDEEKMSLNSFYELAQRDGKEVQTYINSLSEDAKYKGISKYIFDKSGIPNDRLAELCNILYDKSYGKIYDDKIFAFIDENKGDNCENIDGIIELLNAYKGTDVLNSYSPEYKLHVANKDYKGAAEAIKLKLALDAAKLYFNDSAFYEVMYDKNTDFSKFNAILRYMKDNSLNYYDYPYKIYKDENGLNKLELRHLMKSRNLWLNDEQYKELDGLADKIENDDEKAFIKEHLFKKDKNNYIHFNVQEMEQLLAEYRKKPEIIQEILRAKSRDGDIRYTRVENIIPISDAFALDKEYTQFLMNMKEYRGRSRFGYNDYVRVIEAHQIDKAFTNRLLAEITVLDEYGAPHYRVDKKMLEQLNNGKQPDVIKDEDHMYFRHSSRAIRELVDIHSVDPEFTEFLLDKYNNIATDVDDIRTIVNAAQKDKEIVKTLISATKKDYDGKDVNRFSPTTIKSILENMPEDKQFIYDVINATKTDYYNKDKLLQKYDSEEIVDLCTAASINIELTKDLMNEKCKSTSGEYDRFKPSNIKELVKYAQTDMALFQNLRKQTKIRYDKVPEPRYGADDIFYIMQAAETDKPCTLNLLKKNEEYDDWSAYAPYEMLTITKAHQEDPYYVDILLAKSKTNYKKQSVPLFKGEDITHLIEAHKKDHEYTDYLVSKYEEANGNNYTAYNGDAIERIVSARQIDKDYTEELVEQTVKGEDGDVKRFSSNQISYLVAEAQNEKGFIKYLVGNKTKQADGSMKYTFAPVEIETLMYGLSNAQKNDPECKEYMKALIENKGVRDGINTTKFSVDEIVRIVNNTTFNQYKALKEKVGDKIQEYNCNDIITAVEFTDLYQRKSINEIPIKQKKDLLRRLVSANINMFDTSDVMNKDFPLIPNNQERYCEVLPALVRSLGIETNQLSKKQIDGFNKTITKLSGNLAKLSDKEYNELTISQEYNKDDFVKDVLEKVKDLEPKERQRVYDYFGFELHKNPKNRVTGYSIVGYPVNLNNGKKLAEITDNHTKKVVEDLRGNVIKFSEKNKIKSNNKDVEKELNEIAEVLPEIRTMIGKTQHKAHDFDVFKHSLKVMQKVVQDENFEKLNDSDKKIMLLATLMHDITKVEGVSDGTHPAESAYDTIFISKKFNLTKDEEIKLFTLIQHHEWLSHVNTAKSETERKSAQQSVAFDLQQNNLFDLALMFTHADLKAVKASDIFHDKTEGDSRIDFNGERRSFGEAADFHAEKIKEYIGELKKSQPLLPSTKMPKASDVEKLITRVNPDGSTNIKGVYVKEGKDNKRLVVLKFNEVEDEGWEKMGLPKGSSTKGVVATCTDKEPSYDVETGNIKFFVHGLDYPNQLAKFDAFSLLNSDALLSVSYAERPETKFRFFRAQGVMLDVSADYVYGGGNTDAGSGCGKNIEEFKRNYVFGGYREKDRKYISDMVKEATGMNDDEYVEYYEKYKNKPMTAIEPKETRDKIIKAFATINSNSRKGDRQYNEMYLSNPKSVMGVYAYNWNNGEEIPDPIKFLEDCDDRTHFLQDYAVDHDIPFVIFGD